MSDGEELPGPFSMDRSQDPAATVQRECDLKLVWRCLSTFSPKAAGVFLLHTYHQETQIAIAADCGISLSTVRRLVDEAKTFYERIFPRRDKCEVKK